MNDRRDLRRGQRPLDLRDGRRRSRSPCAAGSMYFCATRSTSSFVTRVDTRRRSSDSSPPADPACRSRDRVAHAADRRESARQALDERVLRRLHLVVRDRTVAANAAQLLHELDQRAVALRGHDVAARAERTRTTSVREARAHAVAVALLLADVRVEPRLEQLAEEALSTRSA